jgi:hypothetical protein
MYCILAGQKLDMSDEGKVYAKVFQVKQFPHLSILDPFSGLVMWRKEGWSAEKPLTAAALVEAFLSLRNIDDRKLKPSDQSSSAIMDDNSRGDRSSLNSLFQSWEKLSVGGDYDGSRLEADSAADESSWTNISAAAAAPAPQPIPMEIVTHP